MLRRCRTTASYACLSLSIAAAMLWVHSYAARSYVGLFAMHYTGVATSWEGVLRIEEHCNHVNAIDDEAFWDCGVTRASDHRESTKYARDLGVADELRLFTVQLRRIYSTPIRSRTVYHREVVLPHWFVVAVSLGLAIALRPAPRTRWSLRDALACMTIVAVLAGLLKWFVAFCQR